MEEELKPIINFLNADTNVRNQLIDRLMSNGEVGMEELSHELSVTIFKRTEIELRPQEINRMLSKPYAFGFERFMDEYDKRKLREEELMGPNLELNEMGINVAKQRREQVITTVDTLGSRGRVNNCWQDFVNRGYIAIRDRVGDEYGLSGVSRLEQCSGILKEQMEDGLKNSLNNSYSETRESIQQLHDSVVEMERHFNNNKYNGEQRLDNAALFK